MLDRADESLILAAGRGDRDAFRQLVERHQSAISGFILRTLGTRDRGAAEDLAQEVFLAAWRSARSFRPRRPVSSWLLRIAANRCFNYRRDNRLREMRESAGAAQDAADSGNLRDESDDAARVRAAVEALPTSQRAAIVLRHFHGLSYGEIADVMDVSVPAVESLLFRARKTLHAEFAGGPRASVRQEKKERGPQVSRDARVDTY